MSQIIRLIGDAPEGAGVQLIHTLSDGVDTPPDGTGRIYFSSGPGMLVTQLAGNTIQFTNTVNFSKFMPNDGNLVTPLLGRTNVLGTANQIRTSSFGGAPSHTLIIGLTDDVIVNHDLTALHDLTAVNNVNADNVIGITSVQGGSLYSGSTIVSEGQVTVNADGIDASGVIRFRNLNRGVLQSNHNGFVSSSAGDTGEIIIGQGLDAQPCWRRLYSPNDSITITHDPATGNINLQTGPIDTIEFHAKNLSHAHAAGGRFYFVGDGIYPLGNINSVASQNDINYGNFPSITFSLADDIHIVRDIFAGRDLHANRNAIVHGTLAVTGVSTLTGAVVCGNTLVANTNITSQHGFIRATNGNVVAGLMVYAGTGIISTHGNIQASAGSVIANETLIAESEGADITGITYLRSLATGVLNVDATHQVGSSNGTNGQVLIAATAGGIPQWRNISSHNNSILITNGPNSIDMVIAGTGGNRLAFVARLSAATGVIWGSLPRQYIGRDTAQLSILYDPFGLISEGVPGVSPATFTSPVNGLFQFHFNVQFQATYGSSTRFIPPIVYTHLGVKDYIKYYPLYAYKPGLYDAITSQTIYMFSNQQVIFGIDALDLSTPKSKGITSETYISGFIIS